MIAIVDAWSQRESPPGGSDDDDLLRASAAEAAIVIGDRGGVQRARSLGVRVAHHIGFTPGPRWVLRRRLTRLLDQIGSDRVSPATIWCSGITQTALHESFGPVEIGRAEPIDGDLPFVLPVASDPRAINACDLVAASALLAAAGGPCLIGLPTGIADLRRARRRVSVADRLISVQALALPAPRYLASADVIVDLGVRTGGPIDSAVRSARGRRVDARSARSPLALASCIRSALRKEPRDGG